MDPLSAILFVSTFAGLWHLWKCWSNHEKQLFRLISDRESEKGTLVRVHRDLENRLRVLERRFPLKDNDDQEDQQDNG